MPSPKVQSTERTIMASDKAQQGKRSLDVNLEAVFELTKRLSTPCLTVTEQGSIEALHDIYLPKPAS
jgi:hypothetical protein